MCQCDDACVYYRDCCINRFGEIYEEKNQGNSNLESYLQTMLEETHKYVFRKEMNCEPAIYADPLEHLFSAYVYMTTSCLIGLESEFCRPLDQDLLRMGYLYWLPVLGSNNQLYRNAFCAKCNQVQKYKNVDITSQCYEKKINNFRNDTRNLDDYGTCVYSINVKRYPGNLENPQPIRACVPHIVNLCTNRSNPFYELCKSYNGAIRIEHAFPNRYHKNILCKLCYEGQTVISRRFPPVLECNIPYSVMPDKLIGDTKTMYSILLSYSGGNPMQITNLEDGTDESNECDEKGYVLDIGRNGCFPLTCGPGFILTNQQCSSIQVQTVNKKGITVYLEPQQKSYIFSRNLFCNSKFGKHEDLNRTQIILKHQNLSRVYSTEWFEGTATSRKKHSSNCSQFHLRSDCPMKVMHDYMTMEDGYIFLVEYKERVPPEQYAPLAHGIGVCMSEVRKWTRKAADRAINARPFPEVEYEWMLYTNAIEDWTTKLGIGMNSVFLTWMIIRFLKYSSTKMNVPNYNIVSMAIALIFADWVFLARSFAGEGQICYAISAVLHWSLLFVQQWLLIITYEITTQFRRIVQNRDSRSMARLMWYWFVAITSTMGMIGVMLLIDKYTGYDIGYGQSGVCWISNLTVRIATYIVPVAVIMCVTTTFLWTTIINIIKHNKQMKRSFKDSVIIRRDINIPRLALKVSILMGMCEIIGFIQIPQPLSEKELIANAVFRMLFTMVKSTRGLCMWVMFVIIPWLADKNNKGEPKSENLTQAEAIRSDYSPEVPMKKTSNASTVYKGYSPEVPMQKKSNASIACKVYSPEVPMQKISNASLVSKGYSPEVPMKKTSNASTVHEGYSPEVPANNASIVYKGRPQVNNKLKRLTGESYYRKPVMKY